MENRLDRDEERKGLGKEGEGRIKVDKRLEEVI